MFKWLAWSVATALVLFGMMQPSVAQKKDEEDPEKKREDLFGKPFAERVEDAVDAGCDWLKKQQGIEKGEDPAIFGVFPPNPPLYGEGKPHRARIARTAFPIQALCKSGVFHDEPEIEKAMNWLRKNYKEQGVVQLMEGFVRSKTYEDATVLNAIEAYYISAWEAKARGLANPGSRWKKDENGKRVPIKRWGTEEKGAKKAKKERDFKLDRKDLNMCYLAIKGLETRFRNGVAGGGGWRYDKKGMGESDPMVDVSATQYAILGLKAATRLGVRYDKTILTDAFRYLRGQQDKDGPEVDARWKKAENDEDEADKKKKKQGKTTSGEDEPPVQKPQKLKARGWGYSRESTHGDKDRQAADRMTYGSMTAAGVNALILIRDELVDDPGQSRTWEKLEAECNTMIGDGLAWMIHNWDMTSNPQRGMHRFYYYLYTVERLGMLGGIDEIGGHDWYREGADVLLKQQEKDGKWDPQNEVDPSDIYNTCYALLFLKRATEGTDRPVPVITGGDYD
jgi:hypothetical protein